MKKRAYERFLPLLFLGLSAAGCWATAQAGDSALDTQVEETVAKPVREAVVSGRNSAGVVVFVRDGRVRIAEASGLEDRGSPVAVTTSESRLVIGSISKTFAGVALALLKASGQIASYDDPANRYLREYKLPDANGRQVTLDELATHTSGFDSIDFDAAVPQLQPGVVTARDFQRHQPRFFAQPGDVTAYSRFNVDALGLVISDLAKMPYPQYVESAILKPLGMTKTQVGWAPGGQIPHQVRPYDPFGVRTFDRMLYDKPMSYPSGGVYATADDVGRYMLALLDRTASQGIITPAMQDDMFRIHHADSQFGGAHGLVFEVLRAGPRVLIYHAGIDYGLACFMALLPEEGTGLFFWLAFTPPVPGVAPDKQPLQALDLQRTVFELMALTPQGTGPALAASSSRNASWNPAWNAYLGSFIATSRGHFGIARLRSLLHPPQIVRVTRGKDGLEINGIQGLVELTPGVFQKPGVLEYFNFFTDAHGRLLHGRSTEANTLYELPSPGDDPRLMPALLAAAIGFAATGLLWPFWKGARGARTAQVASVLYALSMLGGALVVLISHPFGDRYFLGIGWPLLTLRVCGFLVLPVALLLTATAASVWRSANPRLPLLARAHFLVLALSALLSVGILVDVGVISFLTP